MYLLPLIYCQAKPQRLLQLTMACHIPSVLHYTVNTKPLARLTNNSQPSSKASYVAHPLKGALNPDFFCGAPVSFPCLAFFQS